jgi:glycosyltransferase involved in cell wall biosynthesis
MKMKTKAIIFYTYLPPWRIDIFNEMAKMYDLTIVFLQAESQGFTYDRKQLMSQLKNVKVIFWNRGIDIKGKAFRFGISNLLKKYNPEIVFTHEYFPISIFLATLKKLNLFKFKLIITTSDNIQIAENVNPLKAIFRNYVLKSSYGIVVYSESVKNWYSKNFPYLKIEICPNIQNPISLLRHKENFAPLISQYREKFKLDKKVLLYVGRLEYVKGLDLLLKFYSETISDEFQLVLVGEGSERENLEQLAKKLHINHRVIFAGQFSSTELYAWYEIAYYFILPSRHEPFGAVVNEALVFGCPVLASKNIGALDYIKEGVNGIIFDPENEIDFKNTLLKLKNDKFLENNKENLMQLSFENYLDAFIKVTN